LPLLIYPTPFIFLCSASEIDLEGLEFNGLADHDFDIENEFFIDDSP
jgi:hypothetical protein